MEEERKRKWLCFGDDGREKEVINKWECLCHRTNEKVLGEERRQGERERERGSANRLSLPDTEVWIPL